MQYWTFSISIYIMKYSVHSSHFRIQHGPILPDLDNVEWNIEYDKYIFTPACTSWTCFNNHH